jgi:hypothetical protein
MAGRFQEFFTLIEMYNFWSEYANWVHVKKISLPSGATEKLALLKST